MKSETLQWSEGERELGSRIVFGWVKGGCKPQATSPKRRLAPSTNHSLLRKEKTNHQLWAELRAQQLIGLFFAVGVRVGLNEFDELLCWLLFLWVDYGLVGQPMLRTKRDKQQQTTQQ